MLCALSGWPDAGQAASGAIEYLIRKWAPRRFAEVEPGAIYVQSDNRPMSKITRPGVRQLRWPGLTLYALPVPHAPSDLILMLGAEPDLRWRTCTRTILDLAERFGTTTVVTLGAFLAPVPHSGQVVLSGRASRPELRRTLRGLGLRDSRYEGPTGFPTVLLDATQRRGLGAASIWAASPIYLRGLANPKLSAALLAAVERVLHVDVGLTELELAGRDLERRIDEELRARPDLERFVRRLSGGAVDEPSEVFEELPGPEELLEDLEQYLRRLQEGDE